MKRGPARRDSNARGFSLIEVVVAILILTVGLLSLAQLMMVATKTNYLSGRVTSAAAIAKERLERLKAKPFYVGDIAAAKIQPDLMVGGRADPNDAGADIHVAYYDPDGKDLPDANGALYLVRWKVEDVNVNLGFPLAMVRITLRCLPAGVRDNYQFVSDARFVTYRTANVSVQ